MMHATCPEHGVVPIVAMGSTTVTLACAAVGNDKGYEHPPVAPAERSLFTFRRRNGACRTFGPYASVDEAKSAFQWLFGYWPNEPLLIEEY